MDSTASIKRHNRRCRKDNHIHSHNPSKWIMPGSITRDNIDSSIMRVNGIHCNKNQWTIRGVIWGNCLITLTNDGEYRTELSWDRDKPFRIGECACWSTATITTCDGRVITIN